MTSKYDVCGYIETDCIIEDNAVLCSFCLNKHRKRKAASPVIRHYYRDITDNYKKNHPCKICGECEIEYLEFHHRDPKTKLYTVSAMVGFPLPLLHEEMTKCDILCRDCHQNLHKEIRFSSSVVSPVDTGGTGPDIALSSAERLPVAPSAQERPSQLGQATSSQHSWVSQRSKYPFGGFCSLCGYMKTDCIVIKNRNICGECEENLKSQYRTLRYFSEFCDICHYFKENCIEIDSKNICSECNWR